MAIDKSISVLIVDNNKIMFRITRNSLGTIDFGNVKEAMDRFSIDKLLASLE